ncbi:MAG TPA: hypothetical protein PLO78_06670 [Candidatus Omnitrophota bacterium]|nr:hypothetical protein [Candidatus Omnitrophota bacterium]
MFGSRLDSQEVSSYLWILAALIMRLRILDKREFAGQGAGDTGSGTGNGARDGGHEIFIVKEDGLR